MSEARNKLDEIKAMNDKRDELLTELDHTVTIQEMIPTAFDHGSARIRWTSINAGGVRVLRGTLIDGNGLELPLPGDAAERLGVRAEDLTAKK